eukprot:NODE_479_length_1888_cov_60.625213_g472_i0.p1 GENE.NODE_479_length_1888_cov_60.625213_g472_i0~~NODE_479_length_1888_cov_60.625213_g472_i0.p1  ORF type:complete len:570 (-),score=44.22 NODE_479_length_1888_cov_60.625213_g472_i0:93-1802(-)
MHIPHCAFYHFCESTGPALFQLTQWRRSSDSHHLVASADFQYRAADYLFESCDFDSVTPSEAALVRTRGVRLLTVEHFHGEHALVFGEQGEGCTVGYKFHLKDSYARGSVRAVGFTICFPTPDMLLLVYPQLVWQLLNLAAAMKKRAEIRWAKESTSGHAQMALRSSWAHGAGSTGLQHRPIATLLCTQSKTFKQLLHNRMSWILHSLCASWIRLPSPFTPLQMRRSSPACASLHATVKPSLCACAQQIAACFARDGSDGKKMRTHSFWQSCCGAVCTGRSLTVYCPNTDMHPWIKELFRKITPAASAHANLDRIDMSETVQVIATLPGARTPVVGSRSSLPFADDNGDLDPDFAAGSSCSPPPTEPTDLEAPSKWCQSGSVAVHMEGVAVDPGDRDHNVGWPFRLTSVDHFDDTHSNAAAAIAVKELARIALGHYFSPAMEDALIRCEMSKWLRYGHLYHACRTHLTHKPPDQPPTATDFHRAASPGGVPMAQPPSADEGGSSSFITGTWAKIGNFMGTSLRTKAPVPTAPSASPLPTSANSTVTEQQFLAALGLGPDDVPVLRRFGP